MPGFIFLWITNQSGDNFFCVTFLIDHIDMMCEQNRYDAWTEQNRPLLFWVCLNHTFTVVHDGYSDLPFTVMIDKCSESTFTIMHDKCTDLFFTIMHDKSYTNPPPTVMHYKCPDNPSTVMHDINFNHSFTVLHDKMSWSSLHCYAWYIFQSLFHCFAW